MSRSRGMADLERDYQRVARAIRWLEANRAEQPRLEDAAAAIHLSPFHFQRLFTAWAGVSPKRFLGFLTVAHARRMLAEQASVLDAALEVGLSGPSRLHDLFVSFEAVTPGEAKASGAGLSLRWGVHPTPFGAALLCVSARGICFLSFLGEGGAGAELARAGARWPEAQFTPDSEATAPLAEAAFRGGASLAVHVSGTNFQVKVWEALLQVSPGRLVDYRFLGRAIGSPAAVRAVGNALAANPVAYLIPCHRVIRSTGAFNDYSWGGERRRAMIGWEAARRYGEELT